MLAIGPLTNLARLLAAGWVPPVVVLMGGALAPVRHRGAQRTVESNVAADPEAAGAVFAGAHPLVVPLDVTVRMRLDADRRAALVRSTPRLARVFAQWQSTLRAEAVPDDEAVVCLHDPLALLVAVGDVPVVVDARRLVVGGDGRLGPTDDETVAPVDVVVDVDTEAALDRVIGLLAGPP